MERVLLSFTYIFTIAIYALAAIGWVVNLVALGASFSLLRLAGVLIPPLGAVLGYVQI